MYYDKWDDLPSSDDEFWQRLEESFFFIECDLLHPVESREEALARRGHDAPGTHFGGLIRYRDTDDRDNLLYFRERGIELLAEVRWLLDRREFTRRLFIRWGELNFCHGWISNAIFSGGDDLGYRRAAIEGTTAKSRDRQKRWVARLLVAELDRGKPRQVAERDIACRINQVRKTGSLAEFVSDEWLAKILHNNGQLRATYSQKHFSDKLIRQLVSESAEELPPLDF
jgi:hypothetical protein